jgi:hypothetical protein
MGPSGSLGFRIGETKQAKGAGPSGQKLRMEKTSISFSFPIFLMHFPIVFEIISF